MKKREDAIMKHRLTACLLAGAMALALGTGAALANGGGVENGGIAAVAARGRNAAFVDEDGDGVCDNCGRGGRGRSRRRTN